MKTKLKVYEMVDRTNDEMYYTLGIWNTLRAAIKALDTCKDPSDIGGDHDDYEEYCCIIINERTKGWGGIGKLRFERTYVSDYNEVKDEYEWKINYEKTTK